MNAMMLAQINQMLLSVKAFEDAVTLAARKDDGAVSKEEEKMIQQIRKASEKYQKQLEKIKGE